MKIKDKVETLMALYDPVDNVFGFLPMPVFDDEKEAIEFLYQKVMVWLECETKEDIKFSIAQCYDNEKSYSNQDINKVANCFYKLGTFPDGPAGFFHRDISGKFILSQRENGEKGQDGFIDHVEGLAEEMGADVVSMSDDLERCIDIKFIRLANERFEKFLEEKAS